MAAVSGFAHRVAMGVLLALILSCGQRASAQAPAPEYQVKSVFLFHFTQFVAWPESAFEAPGAPFALCVLGEDPFGAYLDETVRGEFMAGHPLEVRRLRSVEAAAACHMVFVSESEGRRTTELRRRLVGRPVLTVADLDDFARTGGIIQFVMEQGRIRFRINVDSARAAGLTISSKLLSLADVVTDEES